MAAALAPIAVLEVDPPPLGAPLLLGAAVVGSSSGGGPLVEVMWIVFVFLEIGVGDMLRFRRFTLMGRLLLVVLEVSLALLAPALSEEMAILVESADIDFVMTLLVLLVVLCSTLLLVANAC